jgi:hypothetical protein
MLPLGCLFSYALLLLLPLLLSAAEGGGLLRPRRLAPPLGLGILRNFKGGSSRSISQSSDVEAGGGNEMSEAEMGQKDLTYIESLTKKTLADLEKEGWKAIVAPSSAHSYSMYQRPVHNNR